MNHDTIDLLAPLGARRLADVLNDPVPEFLFENCFRDKSITVLVAPAHRGKTFLMLDMAICLDFELPLLGRFLPLRGRRSFFIGCDAPSWDYGLQARKLFIGHSISPIERSMTDIDGVFRRGLSITDPGVNEHLRRWRSETGGDVLFIDSHRATHEADENSTQEMKHVWDYICKFRDEGWCVIMSHHTSKPTEIVMEDINAPRGSTVIRDSADFIYTLAKRNRADRRVNVCCVKGRGAADEDDPFKFFDIASVQSSETLNDVPIKGVQLICSSEDPLKIIEDMLRAGPQKRNDLGAALRITCPQTTTGMTDEQVYHLVSNRLAELRRLDRAETTERGIWRYKFSVSR